MFRTHKHRVYINWTWFYDLLIDDHITQRHGDTISDSLILQLVSLLHMKDYTPEDIDEKGFEYFVNNELTVNGKC